MAMPSCIEHFMRSPFQDKDWSSNTGYIRIFGMLGKALELFKPTHVAICFDTPKKPFDKNFLRNIKHNVQRWLMTLNNRFLFFKIL